MGNYQPNVFAKMLDRLFNPFDKNRIWELKAFNGSYNGIRIMGQEWQDSYKEIKKSHLKNFYMSKFKYENVPNGLDTKLLEEYLWLWGEVAITKLTDNKWLIASFTTKELNHNNFPLKVRIHPISEQRKTNKKDFKNKTYEVGKDCVIIRAGAGFWLNNRQYYSGYFKVDYLLNEVALVKGMMRLNLLAGRSILNIPFNASDKEVAKIENMILSGKVVLRAGNIQNAQGYRAQQNFMNDFKDRTKELITMYNHYWDEIKDIIGADSNAMPDKAERTGNAEISANNTLSRGVNVIELEYRKSGLESLKTVYNINMTIELNEQMIIKKSKDLDKEVING